MPKILAISGSLRRDSFNGAVLRAIAARAPEHVEVEVLDPAELKALEPYDEDDDTDAPPAGVVALREKLQAADVVLVATPEYNGTVPGQLKHAIDWGSRPRGETAALYAKPVAVVSTSTSDYGALWAGEAARKSLGVAGARVISEVDLAIGGVKTKFDAAGELQDEELGGRFDTLLDQLATFHKAPVA